MMYVKKNDWVQIHQTILQAGERAPQVPSETQKVPLELWVKGFLVNETGKLGDIVTIRTLAGRELAGQLVAKSPRCTVDYGEPQPELIAIGPEIRAVLGEGAGNARP